MKEEEQDKSNDGAPSSPSKKTSAAGKQQQHVVKQDIESLLSKCKFIEKEIQVLPDKPWDMNINKKGGYDDENEDAAVLSCTVLDRNTILRLPSHANHTRMVWNKRKGISEFKMFRWNANDHFYDDCRLPRSSSALDDGGTSEGSAGMLITFQAMANEGIGIALSPKPNYVIGNTYEIYFGISGNTKTTILRKIKKQKRKRGRKEDNNSAKNHHQTALEISIPSRVCKMNEYVSYWICYHQFKLYIGTGDIPGKQCIMTLDDTPKDDEDEDDTANNEEKQEGDEKDEGDQSSTENNDEEDGDKKGEEEDNEKANEKDEEEPFVLLPPKFVGFGNVFTQPQRGRYKSSNNIQIRHLCIMHTIPAFLQTELEMAAALGGAAGVADGGKYFSQYEEEIQKQKQRAEKFGIDFKEPSMAAVLPWSEAKKLQSNPQHGFITGIDLQDPDELKKQEARRARFGAAMLEQSKKENNLNNNKKEQGEDGENNNGNENDQQQQEKEDDNNGNNDSIMFVTSNEAWDKISLVGKLRTDLPPHLWSEPPIEGENNENDGEETGKDNEKNATIAPEKVHICSIDWAAFKQIRTDDIMSYFSIYGPTYVEWLGELSCNVCFEDKHSASRALHALSQEIPSPPPPPTEEEEKNNDDSGENNADTKDSGKKDNDNDDGEKNDGSEGEEVKNKDVDGKEGNDEATAEGDAAAADNIEEKDDDDGKKGKGNDDKPEKPKSPPVPLPDLGRMGWKLCTSPIRKIRNDKFGRRGTMARILMRNASTLDILIERPNAWPRPPRGFTTKEILGPDADLVKNRKRNRNKKKNNNNNENQQQQQLDDNRPSKKQRRGSNNPNQPPQLQRQDSRRGRKRNRNNNNNNNNNDRDYDRDRDDRYSANPPRRGDSFDNNRRKRQRGGGGGDRDLDRRYNSDRRDNFNRDQHRNSNGNFENDNNKQRQTSRRNRKRNRRGSDGDNVNSSTNNEGRQQQRQQQKKKEQPPKWDGKGEHPLLSKGLSSSR